MVSINAIWIEVTKCPQYLPIFDTSYYYIVQVATLREDASGASIQPTSVVEVSESKIDQVMSMLNEADPTLPESDPSGMHHYIFENIH